MVIDEVFGYMVLVVVTQAVMALCIGSFLSSALLVYSREHALSPATTGVLLGVGEGLGAAGESLRCCEVRCSGFGSRGAGLRVVAGRAVFGQPAG